MSFSSGDRGVMAVKLRQYGRVVHLQTLEQPLDSRRRPKRQHKADHSIHGPAEPDNLKTPGRSCHNRSRKRLYSCNNSTCLGWKPEEPKKLLAPFRCLLGIGDTINRCGPMPTHSLFHGFHREFRRRTTVILRKLYWAAMVGRKGGVMGINEDN